jgi:hypothetical protein
MRAACVAQHLDRLPHCRQETRAVKARADFAAARA